MVEKLLQSLVAQVATGEVSRRDFMVRMVGLGVTASMAAAMITNRASAQALDPRAAYRPTKAGGGGSLKLLFWQAPTSLNPHFATGVKDREAARIFYEPLATWDNDGNLVPVLAAEIPSAQSGTVALDGKWVVWRLKPGVRWHDGVPFTADDVVFNWHYGADPATAAVTAALYKDIKVEKLDDLTIKIVFSKPTPFWANAFVASSGLIIPKHHFEQYIGEKSRDAPANLRPIGTGPYRFVEFRPGDMLRGERNTNYHLPYRPFFDTIELKGGGDAVSAARAVLQAGEYDYAWNLQVDDEVLRRLESGGRGTTTITYGGTVEFIVLNATDPWTEVNGERSSLATKHFAFSDPAVCRAMNYLIDRKSIQEGIYGRTARPTANVLNGLARFASTNTRMAFDVAQAETLLEDAGWVKGPDGIRAKDGKRLRLVFQTATNASRQKTQAVIKQAARRAGIDLELKVVAPSVFFSSDTGNPETLAQFSADMQMYAWIMAQPDPGLFMLQFFGPEAATKRNKWQGRNVARWQNAEYDALSLAAQAELDPVKRTALFIRMNDLAVSNNCLPLLHRAQVSAVHQSLRVVESGWDNSLSMLSEWYRA